MPPPVASCIAKVTGRVQGVGFRWWTREQLALFGLTGSARNLGDGSVEVVARGDAAAVEKLLAALRGPDAPGRVDSVRVTRTSH